MKKTIGFVDYYINEWHANNYVGWIKEAAERVGEDFQVAYAWAELDRDPNEGVSTDEWCEKFGVTKCADIDELCRLSDYVIVLAPSNPETHLRYAEAVLKYRKNTYIDKTFAPDLATALKIFDIAKQHNTRFFSSSALRYAAELPAAEGIVKAATTGGGRLFDEYIIHQAEMVVKLLGTDLARVRTETTDAGKTVTAEFSSGKRATMTYAPPLGFSIATEYSDGRHYQSEVGATPFFALLIDDILRFFLSGEVSFDSAQTQAVSALREAAIKSSADGEWIKL